MASKYAADAKALLDAHGETVFVLGDIAARAAGAPHVAMLP